MSTNSEIVYKVAVIEEYDQILEFLRKYYYVEEPITIGNLPLEQSEEDEAFTMSDLKDGTCIVAMIGHQLVGALMAGAIQPGDADAMIEDAKHVKSKKWSEILMLLAHLEEKADVCKRYKVSKSLHMHVLGVDSSFRGKSIGLNLLAKCLENGKSLGFKLASIDCTSIFSAKIAERLEMEKIEEMAYADYKDEQGHILFKPPQPHTHIYTFIKRL